MYHWTVFETIVGMEDAQRRGRRLNNDYDEANDKHDNDEDGAMAHNPYYLHLHTAFLLQLLLE